MPSVIPSVSPSQTVTAHATTVPTVSPSEVSPEQKLFREKKYAEAAKLLEARLEANPEDLTTMKFLADCYYLAGEIDKALSLALKIESRDPKNGENHILLGNIYLYKKKDSNKAIAQFEKALKIFPEDRSLFLNLMEAYFQDYKISKIVKPLEDYLKKYPDDLRAIVIMGEVYIETGRLPKAQKILQKAVEMKPDDSTIWVLLAEAYMDHKQFEKSLEALERAKQLDPDNPDVYLDIGEIHYWQGDYKNAERLIKKALSMDPSYFSPYNELGNLYYLQKRYGEAEKYHKLALERFPGYYDAYKGLGKVYIAQKRYKEGEKAFKKALEIKPYNQGETYVFLSEYYQSIGDDRNREKSLLMAIKTDPNYPDPYKKLIEFYREKNMVAKAKHIEGLMNERLKGEDIVYKTGQ